MEEFKALGVIEPLVRAVEKLQITEPTKIQRKSIPTILKGGDVIAQSATGHDLATFGFGSQFKHTR